MSKRKFITQIHWIKKRRKTKMADEENLYSQPWKSDEFDIKKEGMNSVLIIHTHEGEPIAAFIQENLNKFNNELKLTVNICDVIEVESRNLAFQVILLLITPEMISYLDSTAESPHPSLRFDMSTVCTLLVHESVDMDNASVKSVIETKIPEFNSWKTLKMSHTRTTLMKILHLLDETSELSFPMRLQYRLEPSNIATDRNRVFILFKTEKDRSAAVVVHTETQKVDAKYHNPYTFSFSPYGLPYGKVQINVFVDGENEGTTHLNVGNKFEFLYNEMDDVISSTEFLCQTLKLSGEEREGLDKYLAERMDDDVPRSILEEKVDDRLLPSGQKCNEELPTMLHFGAKFGLSQFCHTIRKTRGFGSSITIRNKENETPCQLAQRMRYTQLSDDLDPLIQVQKESENGQHSKVTKRMAPPPPPKRINPLSVSAVENRSPRVTLKKSMSDAGEKHKRSETGIGRYSGLSVDSGTSGQDLFKDCGDSPADTWSLPDMERTHHTTPVIVEDKLLCEDPFPSIGRTLLK